MHIVPLNLSPRTSSHMVSSKEIITNEVPLDILQPTKMPDSGLHASHSSHEGTPCNVLEKITDDGYNWRKYGQKNVKGNEFIRSYYKCTHFKCLVKKRVERSRDGQIKDTIYFGAHCHPISQSIIPIAASLALPAPQEKSDVSLPAGTKEEKSPEELHQTNQPVQVQPMDLIPFCTYLVTDDDAEVTPLPLIRKRDEVDKDTESHLKRHKKEVSRGHTTPRDKLICEPRVAVQTQSEIDITSDGYRWRKYGQKFVKGNSNPRSYYRCSSAGCSVKKHVERASHDPKVVTTTYEGQHNHIVPPARVVTVTHQTSGDSNTISQARDVVYTPASPNTRSSEQLNGESNSMSQDIDTSCHDDILNSCPGTENICSGLPAIEPKKTAGGNMTVVSSDMSITNDTLGGKLNGSTSIKSEKTEHLNHGELVLQEKERNTVTSDVVMDYCPVPDKNSIEPLSVEPHDSEVLATIGCDQSKSSEQQVNENGGKVSEGNVILCHDTVVDHTVVIPETNSNTSRSEFEQRDSPKVAVHASSCPDETSNNQQAVNEEPE